MKLSSKDLLDLKIIDEVIPEPTGGAHRDKDLILDNVRNSIRKNLETFENMDKDEIQSLSKYLKNNKNPIKTKSFKEPSNFMVNHLRLLSINTQD